MQSVAPSTRRVYEKGLDLFTQFGYTHLGLNVLSSLPTTTQIVQFMGYLSLQKYAPSTIATYVAGVSHHCKLTWGEDKDPTRAFIVSKILEGKRRKDGRVDSRLPLTLDLLVKAIGVLPPLCVSSYECKLFSAVFLLAFYGFLRVSEYTYDSKFPHKCIKFQDLKLVKWGTCTTINLNIPFSKTDQHGKGHILLISTSDIFNSCPVQAMCDYLRVRPNTKDNSPLFIHFDRSPLSRYQMNSVLSKALSVSGISHLGTWGSHSIRIGAATWFFLQKVSIEEIKKRGRWSQNSNVVFRYIRTN